MRLRINQNGVVKLYVLAAVVLTTASAGWSNYQSSCSSGQYLRDGVRCQACDTGYMCPGGKVRDQIKCDQGYWSGYQSPSCTVCPAGFYCNGHPPKPCAAGQWSKMGQAGCNGGETGVTAHDGIGIICGGGEYCPNGSQGPPAACRAGHKCDGSTQVACSPGTYSLNVNPGSADWNVGSSQCHKCPPGYKCLDPAHPPVPCPPGQEQPAAGGSSCSPCPVGHECPGGFDMWYPATGPSKPLAGMKRECQIGKFSPVTGLPACLECPAGMECKVANSYPTACTQSGHSNNYYSLAGWARCGFCPAKFACPGQKTTVACTTGHYSLEGELECTKCPAGTNCWRKDRLPQNCPPGWYSEGGQDECTACPAGHFCEKPNATPSKCPPGKTSILTGNTFCTLAPGGTFASADHTTNTACPAGEITNQIASSALGFGSCEKCPAGYACPGLLFEQIVPCEPGYHSKEGDTECLASEPGFFAMTTLLDSVDVGDGYVSDVAAVTKLQCPAGFKCADKMPRHNVHCPPGSYYTNLACTTCPKGKYCPTDIPGYRPIGTVLDCVDGTFTSATGATECKACPPGFECADKAASPTKCPADKYQPGGMKDAITVPIGFESNWGQTIAICPTFFYGKGGNDGDCLICPPGENCYESDGLATPQIIKAAPTACLAGTYSSTSDFRCVECPKGHKCGASVATATVCPAGTYQSKSKQSTCITCPEGFYSLPGAEYCTPIPKGWGAKDVAGKRGDIQICAHKTYSDLGENDCSVCMDGFLCPIGTGEKSPWEFSCPRGSWCAAGLQTKCAAGKYGRMERATTEAQGCVDCPPGYHCPPGTADYFANPCPRGAYCPKGTAMILCPEGTSNDNMYGRSLADCALCPMGQSCGTGTGSEDVPAGAPCPENKWCGSGKTGYCAPGTYGGFKTGKVSPDQCLLCPPGHYCPRPISDSSSPLPIPAPAGKYSPLSGLSEEGALFLCPPGFFCKDAGMSIYKGSHCKAGYVCPAGSKIETEVSCPEGTWSDRQGLNDIRQCDICPAGNRCDLAATSTNGKITACPQHSYCPAGTHKSDNAYCPAGTFAPYTGAKSLLDCLPCTPGKFCLSDGAGPQVCPVGHYCPEGTRFDKQYACPPGYINATAGGIAPVSCLHCGIGKYCPDSAMTAGITCVAGTYNNIKTSASFCETCPAGYWCPAVTTDATNVDTYEPKACKPGFYSKLGSSSEATHCVHCPIGHFCPLYGTSDIQLQLNRCPEGTYCWRVTGTTTKIEVGLDKYPSSETDKCPRFKYCPKGLNVKADATILAVPKYANLPAIPPGTSQRFYSVGKLSQVESLPAGFYYKYKDADDVTPMHDDACTKGHYCPAGTVTPVGCPSGKYRNSLYGREVSDCGFCPSGTYCPTVGMHTPTLCPLGSYCPEGSIFVSPCPPGTYDVIGGLYDSRECQDCLAGYYCPYAGMNATPTLECDAGFICYGGAARPEPTDEVTGAYCPKGGYCPKGVAEARALLKCGIAPVAGSYFAGCQCNVGFFGLYKGAQVKTECTICWSGFYCPGASGVDAKKECKAGVICGMGVSIDLPAKDCADADVTGGDINVTNPQKGFYADIKSSEQWRCQIGYYSKECGVKACQPCDAGTHCDQTATDGLIYKAVPADAATESVKGWKECKKGYYCPDMQTRHASTSTWYEMEPCEKGYHNPVIAKATVKKCLICPAKKACNEPGLGDEATLPDCVAGFFCASGSQSVSPITATTANGPCPAGSWCPLATETPTKCLKGTFSNQERATKVDYCMPCPPGYLCTLDGLTAPDKDCPFGMICKTTGDGTSGSSVTCTKAGYHCPLNSHEEQQCPSGFYQSTAGKPQCYECPAGNFCMSGSQQPCPKGYYCP